MPCTGEDAQTIKVTAPNGISHDAAIYGSGPAVVIAHQSNQDRCDVVAEARWLKANGYMALVMDFSGDWVAALSAATKALRDRGGASVQLLGGSKGGCAAMVASAAIDPPVQSVVSLSGERSLRGYDADTAVAHSTVPLLIVAIENDGYLDRQDAQALIDESVATDKELLVVSGAAHGFDLLDGSDAVRVRHSILSFLAAHKG